MKKDPKEVHNRYDDPDYQEIIATLKKELKRQRAVLNETDKQYPHLEKRIAEYWDK